MSLLSLEFVFVEQFYIHFEVIMILWIVLEDRLDELNLMMSLIHSLFDKTIYKFNIGN